MLLASSKQERHDLRATWGQAWFSFLFPVLCFLCLRWLFLEPFVIPSGSMQPNLLVHDHILVNKLAYSVHWPFLNKVLLHFSNPKRGDIVVFRYPPDPDIFFIKRIVAVPGDHVQIRDRILYINGAPQELSNLNAAESAKINQSLDDSNDFDYFRENGHIVRYQKSRDSSFDETVVPEQMFFVLGDNRDQSMDSRFWGMVPAQNLLGRASWVWLSCAETLPSAQFICDPLTIRWDRLLIPIF